MTTFSSFFLRSKVQVTGAKNEEAGSRIYVMLDGELSSSQLPHVREAQALSGELKARTLYVANANSKQLVLVLSKDGPKKLDGRTAGSAHFAVSAGGIVAGLILNHSACDKKNPIVLSLSDELQAKISGAEHHFVIGLASRGVSNRVAKSVSDDTKLNLKLERITEQEIKRGLALHESMMLTRSLINMPPNVLNPASYADAVQSVVADINTTIATKINVEVMDHTELESKGCGLIAAVGKGSEIKPKLIRLRYAPAGATKKVTFVGKGITFDSGGLDIKPPSGMRNMKTDMGGSAAALGIFTAAARLEVNLNIDCYLSLAENMVSGAAMRPGDVYKAKNGMQVEIDNTDAEGRLVLADALCFAVEDKPDWICDLATLTGAARVATGPAVDAMFSTSQYHADLLVDAGIEAGDWVWPMPLVDDYETMFDSSVADFTNSSTTGHGGAITAALFLRKFVGNIPWTHIDTYMWCDKPNELYAEAGATARMIRNLVHVLEKM